MGEGFGSSDYALSPFAYVPRVLIGQGADAAYWGFVAIAALLSATGLAGFWRRDGQGDIPAVSAVTLAVAPGKFPQGQPRLFE